jgi:predicted small secreted protein
MRAKLLVILSCVLLAACVDEDIKETGISRQRAISIAKSACKEYPDRFSFVDRAEWIPEKHFWAVELADRSGDNGRVYKINHNGEIVGTRDISNDRRRYDDYDGPYRRGWWY